ncbi:MAG: peptidylprolyl isomerase [Pseudorhodoplanes sp.]|nr:peptidylprolyl isomerase [Pseudorhodoplanes sp.]
MRSLFPPRELSWRLGTMLLAAAACLFLTSLGASAQVVVFVNGQPITQYDIEQRSRLAALGGGKKQTREEVLNDLIDDKLKLSVGKLYSMDPSQSEIEGAFANIARNIGASPEAFAKSLQQAGVNPNALKARLAADMVWAQIIRGKFGQSLQVGEKDILTAMEARGKEGGVGYEYQLRPILFVAPRGAADSIIEGRKREAEALRSRFQDCDEGITLARGLRDVVVRETIRRNSADLSEQLRVALDRVEVGRLTPPEVTPGGVEVFAVCAKKETTADSPMKKAIRDELYSAKFNAQAQRYLKELRKGAMIEYK